MEPLSLLGVALATALLVAAAAAVLGRGSSSPRRKQYRLPPGPRPWPVIGNLNLIGALPHRSIHALSARHGASFMSLRFGSVPVVVGASMDAARFFLRTNDAAFIDRPRMASGKHTAYNYSDIVWSPYGAYWRQARKLWQTKLLNARQLRLQEHVRREELQALLRDLHGVAASSGSGGRVVKLKEHLLMLSLNVISRMALGGKYVGEGTAGSPISPDEFRWMVEELFHLNGVFCVGDFIPWLGWLDIQGYVGRMKRLGKMFDRFLEHVLDEHNERRRREGDKFVASDMIDLLLELADDPNLEVPIGRDGVKGFALDLIAGGTDTSAVNVEWAMSELLRNPDALAKATEELDAVIGPGRHVTEDDISKLPYLESIVKETMRLHPVTPLLAPRLTREDTTTPGPAGGGGGGYDVPAGTVVFVNVWAIGRDPAVWGGDAEEFRPERFAGRGVDVKGQDLELLPFGAGRRMCPGYALGLKMVQVTLANLLHAFAWRLPDGVAPEKLCMQEKFGLAVPRLVPLQAVAEPRLPAHLYAGP